MSVTASIPLFAWLICRFFQYSRAMALYDLGKYAHQYALCQHKTMQKLGKRVGRSKQICFMLDRYQIKDFLVSVAHLQNAAPYCNTFCKDFCTIFVHLSTKKVILYSAPVKNYIFAVYVKNTNSTAKNK
jgi:hypothetical protein